MSAVYSTRICRAKKRIYLDPYYILVLHCYRVMALQEEGWPLGLRPVTARVGLVRNRDFSGSISFSTLLTGSPPPSSTTDSSSDLDTESTGSFFHDKSITLGSLIGVSSILELSRRSTRRRTAENIRDQKSNCKPKPWLFSLCSRLSTDAADTNHSTPSLGHFLEEERRTAASNINRRDGLILYGPNDFSPVVLPNSHLNSLFVGDHVAPQSSASNGLRRSNTELLEHGNGNGAPLLFSCLCAQLGER
ncbi:uncharacterized protein LOC8279567 [Ricinus communis]|nr:uncharacterized protein LOC8279567 [Ricinus communis]